MKTVLVLCIGVLASLQAEAKIPTMTGDYCKDEAYEFIEQQWGGAVKPISVTK